MAHIKNPERYWLKAHQHPRVKQLNEDLEFFFHHPFFFDMRIFDVISYINKNFQSFEYVTNYKPYYNQLMKTDNIIIDWTVNKIILIPFFDSIDNARTFNNIYYQDFPNYIIRNLKTIPSTEFLSIINSKRYNVIYFANQFINFINECEKNNSIKFVIDLLNYNISYNFKKSVTFNPSPIYHTIPGRDLPPVPPLIKASEVFADSRKLIDISPILKEKLISYLSGNITDDKLKWINNIFDSVFSYSEFVEIANNNKLLTLDLMNKTLSKKILNPEDS